MDINGYTLANQDKLTRAAEGSPTAEGTPAGGVGYDDKDLLLAQYDKLGGLILNAEGRKVKTGSFFDFKANAPRKTPEVMLMVQVGFEWVEIPEGEPLPVLVRAADALAAAQSDAKAAKKVKKAKA